MSKDASGRRDAPKINSRAKGIRGEYKCRDWFRRWKEFADTERSFGQARRKYSQPDIIGQITEHFYVEAKWYDKVYPYLISKWVTKLVEDYNLWRIFNPDSKASPVLMWKEGRNDWRVLMNAVEMSLLLGNNQPPIREDFLDLEQTWEIDGKPFAAALDKHFEIIKED